MELNRLNTIFKKTFKIKKISKKNSSRSSNKKWDSLKHIELISEIEYSFKIKLKDHELNFKSLENIKKILEKRKK